MTSAADALDGQYEMVRMQRKRAPPDGAAMRHDDGATLDRDPWHVLDNATNSSSDEDHGSDDDDGDDAKKKKSRPRQKLRVASARVRAEPLGFVRRVLGAAVSTQAVVALGIAWCSALALLLFKWLWFYTGVVKPLEKWLGSKQRPEAEPILVCLLIVAPFVFTGVVFFAFRPPAPRFYSTDASSFVEKLRSWRRSVVGGRLDSVDLAVVLVFAVIQINALVGKLLVDQLNGKLAKSGYLNRTGRALGMNGFYAVLISIVLVSRRSFVHEFLQLSSERAAKYHVWCGNFGAISLAFHGLIYCLCWIMEGKLAESLIPCFDCEAKRAYKSLRNFSGLFAQVMLMAVVFASLERVRRRHFRRFTLVHCLNVLFVAGTCVHYYPAVYWFVAPMLVYVMYRIISVFTRSRSGVVSARALDDAIVQLQLRRDGVGLGRQDFVPGQYVYIKLDEISKNEWHPFTISSSPLRDLATLSLDIKVHGPFTQRLLDLVRSGSISNVQLDGYYGTGIQTSSDMVFFAGGSGMTPFLSVLEHYVLLSQQEDVSATLPQRLWIVWTARDVSLLNAHMPLLDQVRTSSAWQARVLLHWTGVGDIRDEDALEGVGRVALGDKSAGSQEAVTAASPEVSYAVVLTATVTGAVLAMALVFMMETLSTVWWLKRVSLLVAGVLGAMAGASTILWRALPSRAGFERVQTSDMDMAVTPLKVASTLASSPPSIAISHSRPSIEVILSEMHATTKAHGAEGIRVLVSGPSELQQRVVDASVPFRSPVVSVECRSFAL